MTYTALVFCKKVFVMLAQEGQASAVLADLMPLLLTDAVKDGVITVGKQHIDGLLILRASH